jgi:hypothetical protein
VVFFSAVGVWNAARLYSMNFELAASQAEVGAGGSFG